MGKVKEGMTSDEILKKLGKPNGPSEVLGEDDPSVVWPYRHVKIHFKKRERDGITAWRVVKRARP